MSEHSTTGPDDRQRLAELLGPVVEEAGLVPGGGAPKTHRPGLVPLGLGGLPPGRTGSGDPDRVAAVAPALSAALDRDVPVPGSACKLEVASPGATRGLVAPRHWRRAVGRRVRGTPVEGEKFTARLLEVGDDGVVLQRSHQAKKGMQPRLLDPERWAFEAVRRAKVEVEFTD